MNRTRPVHDGLFVGTADGPRLVAGRCGACRELHFPVAPCCPYCGRDDVEPRHVGALGSLHAWTAVTAAPPGYGGPVPYGFGIVAIEEGIHVVTRLTEADPSLLAFGDPMRLVLVRIGPARGRESAADGDPDGPDTSIVTWAYEQATGPDAPTLVPGATGDVQ